MPLLDDVRRWAKDRFSQDEYIDGTPKQALREAWQALPGRSQEARANSLEHVRAYATYYYEQHQKERFVPADVRQELVKLERQIERMKSVDSAREILHKYGGAPTMHTIYESVERSEKEREAQRITVKPDPQRETVHESETPGWVREFGSVSRQNVQMPSGNLGESEKRNRFEIVPREDGYMAELSRRLYLKENGTVVEEKDLPRDRHSYGPFATEAKAKEFIAGYISDYHGAEREHQRAGIEHQRQQDKEEIADRQSPGIRMRM